MENLSFETGIKTFSINGDESRTISFSVTDTNLMVRLLEVKKNFEELAEKYDNDEYNNGDIDVKVKFLTEMEEEIKKNMNYLFNADVYDALFNGASPFTMINGEMLFERVFAAITPIIEKYSHQEEKKTTERIKKYQKAYKK